MKSCLEFELSYSVNNSSSSYPVIIVAAGSATRMKGIDKLSADIGGRSVLAATVSAFDKSDRISEIVIVTRPDKIGEYSALKVCYGLKKPIRVVEGGASREESVLCGINALSEEYEKTLIHDGARPIVSLAVIERVADALDGNDSVSCAVKIKDTVKVVNEDSIAVKTLNRDALVSIQTPQGVLIDSFKKASESFLLSDFTDDTSVVEAVGVLTRIVEGDYKNIKITTPEDIALAKVYLEQGE